MFIFKFLKSAYLRPKVFCTYLLISTISQAYGQNIDYEILHFKGKTIYLTKSLGEAGLENLYQNLTHQGLPKPEIVINLSPLGYLSYIEGQKGSSVEELIWAKAHSISYLDCFQEHGFFVDDQNFPLAKENIHQEKYLSQEARELVELALHPQLDGGADDLQRLIDFLQTSPEEVLLIHDWNGRQGVRLLRLALQNIESPHLPQNKWVHATQWKRPEYLTHFEYQAYKAGPYDLSLQAILGLRLLKY